MTNPAQSRDSRLAELVCTATALAHGMGAYDQRLTELGAGFPAGGGGGGSKGDHADPTHDQARARLERTHRDPAKDAQARFDKRLEAAQRALADLWAEYSEVAHVRLGKTRIEDPGCELCNEVPDHWCMTFASVEVTSPPKRKGQEPTVRKVRLCSFCYGHQRPDRAGQLPDYDDVVKHSHGQRVSWRRDGKAARAS